MTVEFGNIYYFLYIIISVGWIVGAYFALKNKTEKTRRIVIFSIFLFNFILHFVKLAFPPYVDNLPKSIHKATLENICAVSTVLFPFLFLIKKQTVIHDYVYFIGFMGGFLALVYPTEALGKLPFAFDTIRFYLCHSGMLGGVILSALFNINKPRLKKFWAIPLLFLAQELIIMLNEIVLIKTGIIDATLESFLYRGSRNNSFVHGPTPDMDGVGKFLTFFTPKFMTQDVFNINNGVDFYWPVLWLLFPTYVYFPPIYFIIASPLASDTKVLFKKLLKPFKK